ncbi:hypothetical protein BK025_03600 [Sodalis sp. TME1]|nr:hypothetical protein BK025_03600 [Sodalis sp. TME1]
MAAGTATEIYDDWRRVDVGPVFAEKGAVGRDRGQQGSRRARNEVYRAGKVTMPGKTREMSGGKWLSGGKRKGAGGQALPSVGGEGNSPHGVRAEGLGYFYAD